MAFQNRYVRKDATFRLVQGAASADPRSLLWRTMWVIRLVLAEPEGSTKWYSRHRRKYGAWCRTFPSPRRCAGTPGRGTTSSRSGCPSPSA
ncbi:hypothetical protein CEXT_274791 [Caerostris extrusa]|uniref:Uncharacterized protein n=1 Tax=Caerostris extrusa TaxID=172846 RepID=A0AAV4MYZ2_CAEEX|nr:hypothetical protein CEXT_274791 [Caerostris extrusa]